MIKPIVTKNLAEVKGFIDSQFEMQLHSKQRLSLSNAVIGTLTSGTLIVSQIIVAMDWTVFAKDKQIV